MRPNLLIILGLAAVLSLGISVLAGAHIMAAIMTVAAALRGAGPLGLALFAAGIFLCALAGIVPGALLGLTAGAIFGIATGFATAAISIMAGAAAAFGLSRSALRPRIGALLARHGMLAKLDGAIAADGWRLVALLRVSPVMPFSLTSYALGFSSILLRDYMLGTLASLPALLGYVAIGALGGATTRLPQGTGRDIHIALLALGAAATLALIWHMGRLLSRALRTA